MHVPIHTGREKKDKDINQDISSGSALIVGFLFLLHTLFSTINIHYSQSGKGGRDKQEVQCTYLI